MLSIPLEGISLEELLISIIIFAAFAIGGWIFKLLLDRYISGLAEKTETKLDDIIIQTIRTPLLVIFLTGGAEVAIRYLTLPARIGSWIHPILYLIIGLAALAGTIRLVSGVLKHYGKQYPGLKPILPTLDKIIKIIIGLVGLMIILSWLGIAIAPLLMSFGVAGLAVGLALKGTLEDFFAGINIMGERAITVGDFIKLESGEEGYVQDIGWRTTKVRMLPNNIVIIPNSKLSKATVTNYYSPEQEMSTLVEVGVSYDSDLRKVEEVTVDVAKKVLEEVPGGVEDFEPFIRYHTFNDFSIDFTVILRVKEFVDRYSVTTEFIKALRERYREEGITIPFPIQTLTWKEDKPVLKEKSEKKTS